jgi:hypothetical protein
VHKLVSLSNLTLSEPILLNNNFCACSLTFSATYLTSRACAFLIVSILKLCFLSFSINLFL